MTGVKVLRTGDLLDIAINRPERRNALGEAEWRVLDEAITEAENDRGCEFLVLRGLGDFFCAGVDIKQIEQAKQSGTLAALMQTNTAILRRLEQLRQIVIVALNGPAIGIGVHLALNADIVLATNAAYMWVPEAKLGIPDVLHLRTLERRLGRSAAFAMLLLGEKLSADDAQKRGLVAALYPDHARLEAGADDYLARLRAVPLAVRNAFKRYASALPGRSDADAQLAASAFVFEQGREG